MDASDGDGGVRYQRRLERERRRQAMQRRPQESSDSDSDTELLMSMANMKVSEDAPVQYLGTGFVYDELMTRHKCEWDESYPENPERILQPLARCQQLGLVERCTSVPMIYATEDQIQWQHSLALLELAKTTAVMTPQKRMKLAAQYNSWYCNEATFECSLAAAGSTIQLLDEILHNKVTNGFALIRPPGHHAMQEEFCGYCTFNNVALAATHALNCGIERILIMDWDVHHGQATQYMFYDDPRVMYFSIHRYEHGEFWPNLRESDYDFIGEGKGVGYNVNVPLNKTGMGDADYMAVFQTLVLPLAYEFSPQVIIVSSGYDAAVGCPEGEMLVSPAAYAHFIHMLSSVCGGRICTVLEGGYCLQSLAEGCAMTLRSLLGDPCPMLPPLEEPSESMVATILNVVKVLRPYWKCLQVFDYPVRGEACTFEEVNSMPPRDNVSFETPENRPETYEIMGNYPQQSLETINSFAREISRLIAEISLTKAPNKTCFVFDADMRKHKNMSDSTHPERPKRISAIFEKHREWGLLKRCLQLKSRKATEEEILEVHRQHYLEDMKATVTMEEEELSSRPAEMHYNSIFMCRETYECALLSAGCVLQAVETVLSGEAQSGVAIVRPPGHHAECHTAMGFCFFNNVAVAAVYAQKKFDVKRILILDWDVHHGNATQHMFYADPNVLYISLHRYENGFFFPGSKEAAAHYTGQGRGTGFNVNIPWSRERMGDAEYMAAFQRLVMPIAYEFGPELVLVSAGYDAALGDYLGGYRVTPECYGHMTHMLSGLANGRVVLALEGGYNLNSISVSMATCTSVLLGDPCPPLNMKEPNSSSVDTIRQVLSIHKEHWKSLKSAVPVPVPQLPSEENLTTLDIGGREGEGGSAPDGAGTPAGADEQQIFPTHGQGDLSNNRNPPFPADISPAMQHVTLTPSPEPMGTPADHSVDGAIVGAQLLKLSSDAGDTGGENTPEDPSRGQGQTESVEAGTDRRTVKGDKQTDGLATSIQSSRRGHHVTSEQGTDPSQQKAGPSQQWPGPEEPGLGPSQQGPGPEEPGLGPSQQGPGPEEPGLGPSQQGPGPEEPGLGPNEEGLSGEELLGACGGSSRPNTVQDVLRMQGMEQLFAVQPAPWCPHLTCVQPLPPGGLDTSAPCRDCGDPSENWVCLVCYKVFCSRYVQEHMLFHSVAEEGHLMVLSYSDLSVWCYACNDYIDNQITYPMKDAAHRSKFGEALPGYCF